MFVSVREGVRAGGSGGRTGREFVNRCVSV